MTPPIVTPRAPPPPSSAARLSSETGQSSPQVNQLPSHLTRLPPEASPPSPQAQSSPLPAKSGLFHVVSSYIKPSSHETSTRVNGHAISPQRKHARPSSHSPASISAQSSDSVGPLELITPQASAPELPISFPATQSQQSHAVISKPPSSATSTASTPIAQVPCVTASSARGSSAPETTQPSPIIGYPLDRPQIYHCPAMKVDPFIQARWDEELFERLQGELNRLAVTWMPNLCMAASKNKRDKLRPMLVIVCISLEHSRIIAQQLNPGRFVKYTYYKRLLAAGIAMAIVLDPVAGLKGLEDAQAAYLARPPNPKGLEVEIGSQTEVLHGRSVRLVDLPSVSATFGGLIKIGPLMYGLTVAHPFVSYVGKNFAVTEFRPPPNVVAQQSSQRGSFTSLETDLGDVENSSIWSDPQIPEESVSEPDLDRGVNDTTPAEFPRTTATESHFRRLGHITAVRWRHHRYHLPACHFIRSSKSGEQDMLSASDWALIELSDNFIRSMHHAVNRPIDLGDFNISYILPTEFHSQVQNYTSPQLASHTQLPSSHLLEQDQSDSATSFQHVGAPVTPIDTVKFIGSMSGIQHGVLSTCVTGIGLDGFLYKTLSMQLSHGLVKGDSGSWVFRPTQSHNSDTNAFLSYDWTVLETVGMVIAGGTIFPFAYLLPILDVVRDINVSLGVSATVPTSDEIWSTEAQMGIAVTSSQINVTSPNIGVAIEGMDGLSKTVAPGPVGATQDLEVALGSSIASPTSVENATRLFRKLFEPGFARRRRGSNGVMRVSHEGQRGDSISCSST